MTTITLPPELERVLAEQARLHGTTPEILAIDKLRDYFLPSERIEGTEEGETMADFLKEYIGSIDSRDVIPGGANMSEFSGRKLGEIVMKKHKKGNL